MQSSSGLLCYIMESSAGFVIITHDAHECVIITKNCMRFHKSHGEPLA